MVLILIVLGVIISGCLYGYTYITNILDDISHRLIMIEFQVKQINHGIDLLQKLNEIESNTNKDIRIALSDTVLKWRDAKNAEALDNRNK